MDAAETLADDTAAIVNTTTARGGRMRREAEATESTCGFSTQQRRGEGSCRQGVQKVVAALRRDCQRRRRDCQLTGVSVERPCGLIRDYRQPSRLDCVQKHKRSFWFSPEHEGRGGESTREAHERCSGRGCRGSVRGCLLAYIISRESLQCRAYISQSRTFSSEVGGSLERSRRSCVSRMTTAALASQHSSLA